jgi:tricorn protease
MKSFLFLLMSVCSLFASAQTDNTPRWLGTPSISPDGKWIAFEYKGDIFKVSSAGGPATAITITTDYETNPVWSHDGKHIAFASDRYGNMDVYVMPAEGGNATRLTMNSAADIPSGFTADDKSIIFSTSRNDVYTSVRFPIQRIFWQLYSVPVKGGRSVMINSAGMECATYNKDGSMILYQDRKGFESDERKHERASVTRDIWTYDVKSGKYSKLTDFQGNDLEPVWGEGNNYYYVSEKNDNDLNVYQAAINENGEPKELTHFKRNPVRGLSRSGNGTLCFIHAGDIYTLMPGSEPQKVNIILQADFAQQSSKNISVTNKDISEMALSPDGMEVAFVYHGDIFVASADGTTTKRLTNTPYQERMIEFSPGGRSLLYSVENNNSWNIDQLHIANNDEPYFYAATIVENKPIIATDKDEFQGQYSPDGKKIAYLEERNILKVYDIENKKTVTVIPQGINFSYSDGDEYFTWSPDSKWLLANSAEGTFNRSEIDLVKADGSGERKNLTESGFEDGTPKWGMKGKMMLWISDREGLSNPSRGGQGDVYTMFFNKKAFDRFNLSKEDYALLKKEEKKDTAIKKMELTDKKGIKKKDEKDEVKNKEVKPLDLDLSDLDSRTKRLTINSSLLSDFILSKDGEKLFYLAKYEDQYNLWQTDIRTHDTKVLAHLNAKDGGSLAIDTSGKTIFVLAGGKISSVSIDGKEKDENGASVKALAFKTNFNLDAEAERAYIFEHTWRQVSKKLFDLKYQDVDWAYYHDFYKQFLPYVNNNYDFRVLLSEMLGELNVSHTGGRYSPKPDNPDATASLGMLYNLEAGGNGLKVEEILVGGPMDNSKTKVKRGDILEKINGTQITPDFDWAALLNRAADAFTRLSFMNPSNKQTWDEVIKPISGGEEQALMYNRWVESMQKMTDSLSGGQVGYVHVKSMDDPSFRTVINKVLGKNFSKKALIVDTRFNGGGWLHDHLVTFLSGKLYMQFAPQGQIVPGGESTDKWTKPSCVVMSESNYSDAFMFPYIYKELGVGKLIGMPVPGTGTAVWWEKQIDPTIVFGIPMIATKGVNEDHFTENHQLEPDIKVENPYNKILNGQDPQIQAAVKEMMKEKK